MAAARKLLADMEKVFRKIDEGVQQFEEIMTKLEEANSENQREKFQDDLKKEIKKLQRLRDQIKGWQNSNDIKDKEKLITYRKKIEEKMEQFKDVERENKTKPHSKQGLSAEDKMDPREREKNDTVKIINTCIERLKSTEDMIESEIEKCSGGKTKKKVDKEKQKRLDELRKNLDRHLYQIQKLELIMRLLTNDTLQASEVNEAIGDHITDYVDADDDDVDLLPEDMYDYLELGDLAEINQQLGNVTNIGTLEETEHNENSPSTSPGLKTIRDLMDETAGLTLTTTRKERHVSGDAAVPLGSAPVAVPTVDSLLQRAPSGIRPLNTTMGVGLTSLSSSRSTPNTPLKLTSQQSLDSALASPPLLLSGGTPPLPSVGATTMAYSMAAGSQRNAITPTLPSMTPQKQPVISSPITVDSAQRQRSKTPVLPTEYETTTNDAGSLLRNTNSTLLESARAQQQARSVSPSVSSVSASTNSESGAGSGAGSVPPQPSLLAQTSPYSSLMNGPTDLTSIAVAPSTPAATGDLTNVTSVPSSTQQNGILSLKSMAEQAVLPSLASTSSSSTVTAAVSSSSGGGGVLGYGSASMAAAARAAGLPLSAFGLMQPTMQQQKPPQSACIPPELGASPLGKVDKTHEYQSDLNSLEHSSYRLPVPIDTEKVRTYMPRMAYTTPPYYPQSPLPGADTVEYYARLSPETLFFIFYYMEGTRSQLLAAKALKKQSWRFHKKFMMWFQRHQEPKTITDDYELGTYIYFDIERWAQKKRDNFTFEYKYLEDRNLD